MISIFKKELRDCLRWVPAGMLIAVVMMWQYLPSGIDWAYEVETSLMSAIGWSGVLVAFSLGLLQSLFDTRNDARGYLLHRPIQRSDIFWAKLTSGFIAYAVALAPGVMVAVLFLNSKGIEYLPVSVWQVIPGLLLALPVFLLHPVAMWIGNRDAKWVGTRVLPLAGILTVLYLIGSAYQMGFQSGGSVERLLMYVGLWFCHIAALVIVLVAARHAFCNSQMLPPASGTNSFSWASIVGLTFSALVSSTVVVSFGIQAFLPVEYSSVRRQLLMNAAGEFQQVSIERDSWDWYDVTFSTRSATESSAEFVEVDDQWELAEYSVLQRVARDRYSWFEQFRYMGQFGTRSSSGGPTTFWGHRGRLLAYGRKHLKAIVTPNGVSRDGEKARGRFENLGVVSDVKYAMSNGGQLGINPLVADATGVFQLDSKSLEMHQLLSTNASRLCVLFTDDRSPATLWAIVDGGLVRLEISAADNETKLDEEKLTKNHHVLMPLLNVDSVKNYEIDLSGDDYSFSVFRGDDGEYGYVKYDFPTKEHFYGTLDDDGSVARIGPVVVPKTPSSGQSRFALGVPPAVICVGGIVNVFLDESWPEDVFFYLVFTLVQALLAAVGTFFLCNWLALSNRHCWMWTVVAALGGWGICFAVVACHRRLVKEVCRHCKERTRVDLETCTHCSKPWLPPEPDHIEIFDSIMEPA